MSWLAFPALTLRVYADELGMHVRADIVKEGHARRLERETIADVVFKPSQVTELSVVDWGQRCLADWLAKQYGEQIPCPPPGS